MKEGVPPTDVNREPINFLTSDGYLLGGIVFRAAAQHRLNVALLIIPGVGATTLHYTPLARYLAVAGMDVLCFDFRGLGLSRNGSLIGFEAGLEDWCEYDIAAAIDELTRLFANSKRCACAHSVGCALLMAAPNVALIERFVLIAPHTGRLADYRWQRRFVVRIVYGLFMPTITALMGYFPASWFRLGADLPPRVAFQWGRQSRGKDVHASFAIDFDKAEQIVARMRHASGMALILSTGNDEWASENAVRRFLHATPQIQPVRRIISATGNSRTGHWSYFRRTTGGQYWAIVGAFLGA